VPAPQPEIARQIPDCPQPSPEPRLVGQFEPRSVENRLFANRFEEMASEVAEVLQRTRQLRRNLAQTGKVEFPQTEALAGRLPEQQGFLKIMHKMRHVGPLSV